MGLLAIGADSMGAITLHSKTCGDDAIIFAPTGFWSVGAIAFLVYFLFINVCLLLWSVDCIQRVIQCAQGPPELLWLCRVGRQSHTVSNDFEIFR